MTQMSPTAVLDDLFTQLQTLKPDSPPAEFERLAQYFSPQCSAAMRSMRESPVQGHQALVADLKEYLKLWHLDERRVTAQALSADGKTVMCEMSNRVDILGDKLDPYAETAVVKFQDGGLIENFRMYGCQSPIVYIIQKKTGAGPYHEEEMEADHTMYNIQHCC